ncbi:exocyst complex subunit Sec15-like-domain-containing protein [Chytridium lagenaria]|nr:exocyst complex subunit Sec15-like-domain-containing protein [Chytridium lagenaria]
MKSSHHDGLEDCQTPNLYLSIKILVVSFIKTMESYGYPVNNLMTLMLSLFDRYTELMKFHCSEKILEIIEEDAYEPMLVESADEYEEIMKAFRIKDEKKTQHEAFPQCCDCVKKFINGFYQFSDGFSQQNNEMDDLLKKSLENLLIQSLSNALTRVLGRSTLPQAVQILTDADYFVQACGEFESILSERRTSQKTKTSLHATSTFKEFKGAIEKRIFDLVNMKVDEYLDVTSYEWTPATAKGQASQCIQDIITSITTAMSSTLSNLPTHTKNFIYFNAIDHMALSIHVKIPPLLPFVY